MAVSAIDQLIRMVSLSKNRQLSQFSVMYDIENFFQHHQDLVIENWHFYNGLHKLFFKKYQGENIADFAARVEDATIENHIKHIVDLMVAHLYGDGRTVQRYVKRMKEGSKEAEVDEELMRFFKERVWRDEYQSISDDNKALNTLVSGYSIVGRKLIDSRTGKEFDDASDNFSKAKYGVIVKKLRDSAFCVPFPYIDENNIVDSTRVGSIFSVYDYDNFIGNKTLMSLIGRTFEKMQFMEYIDDDVWLKWKRKEGETQWTQITVQFGSIINKNPFRRIDVPFTVYRNTGDPFYIEGEPEINSLKSMNLEIDELGSGDKALIRYHQSPILAVYGGKFPEGFVRTLDALVEFPDKKANDVKAEYITWDGQTEASKGRQDDLRRVLSMVSGISLISRGMLKEIGQIRSGPPLKALFTSERSVMARKFAQFRVSEIEEMKADLLFFSKVTGRDFKLDPTVSFHIDFDPDFLGIDKLLDEEIKALQRQSGTESVEEILRAEHPDWTEKQLNEATKAIEKISQQKGVGPKAASTERKSIEQGT